MPRLGRRPGNGGSAGGPRAWPWRQRPRAAGPRAPGGGGSPGGTRPQNPPQAAGQAPGVSRCLLQPLGTQGERGELQAAGTAWVREGRSRGKAGEGRVSGQKKGKINKNKAHSVTYSTQSTPKPQTSPQHSPGQFSGNIHGTEHGLTDKARFCIVVRRTNSTRLTATLSTDADSAPLDCPTPSRRQHQASPEEAGLVFSSSNVGQAVLKHAPLELDSSNRACHHILGRHQ